MKIQKLVNKKLIAFLLVIIIALTTFYFFYGKKPNGTTENYIGKKDTVSSNNESPKSSSSNNSQKLNGSVGDNQSDHLDEELVENEDYMSTLDQYVVELYKSPKGYYYFKDISVNKEEILLLIDEPFGLALKKDNQVSINVNFGGQVPKKIVVGYIHDDQFTEIKTELSTRSIKTAFNPPKDGDYTICIVSEGADVMASGTINIEQ
ncbi:hypothetical protein [Siminovitchia terrae]|uniref:hypothetical protein n=1 Tax=Siminovitchia terrae TaxID=1914933 RepID=UPI0028AA8B5B|nr:hypothetical protein [Siminovitchia terrae]